MMMDFCRELEKRGGRVFEEGYVFLEFHMQQQSRAEQNILILEFRILVLIWKEYFVL